MAGTLPSLDEFATEVARTLGEGWTERGTSSVGLTKARLRDALGQA